MDALPETAGAQAAFCIVLLRRHMAMGEDRWARLSPGTKEAYRKAEQWLQEMDGLELAKVLINRSQLAGWQLRI